jgi:hypothetical protein
MSNILYYLPNCEYCKNLLNYIQNKVDIRNKIHFIDVTNRVKHGDKVYVILNNNNKFLIPSNVKNVPCLILIESSTNSVCLFGDDIFNYLRSIEKKEVLTPPEIKNDDIGCFSFNNSSSDFYHINDSLNTSRYTLINNPTYEPSREFTGNQMSIDAIQQLRNEDPQIKIKQK